MKQMAIDDYDDSFTKPGAIPFKWEIRPGVPKIQTQQQKQPLPPPPHPHIHKHLNLKPPPSGSLFLPPPEPHTRSRSFRSPSAARTRSERWRFEQPDNILARRPGRPDTVSAGCFMSPLLRRKSASNSKRGSGARTVPVPESEPDYTSDLETLARWSLSSRKSLLSPFRDSPTSTSSSSSPRPVCDAEWAGFGLF